MLENLPKVDDPNLLVGFETSDDAAVYRLTDEIALVLTADFITPPHNDPYIFGQVAAANALSDVFAMGGRPVVALNLVGFPSKQLPPEDLNQLIAGALSKITEAGAVLGGGHSVDDDEPKFGLSVTGVVNPNNYWTNAGAQAGDVLILTKPIGSGVLFNANIKGWVSDNAMKACIDTVTTLNRTAAEVLQSFSVHAATDITGFGLAGHGLEMAKGSGVQLQLDSQVVPLMDEATAMYAKGMSTGANKANRAIVGDAVKFEASLTKEHAEVFFDPQTSGGLFVALPEAEGQGALSALHEKGVSAATLVGKAVSHENGEPYIVLN